MPTISNRDRPFTQQTHTNRGRAELRARARHGHTAIVHQYSRAPLQWLGPLDPNSDRPTLYLRNPNGGLLGGDSQSIHLHLEPDSHIEIRTQSATRLHPGYSRQTVTATLSDRSSAVWLPHPTIPGTATEYEQQVRFELEGNARLAYGEVWTAGRLAMQQQFAPAGVDPLEQWRFRRLSNRLAIDRDGSPVLREAIATEFPHTGLTSPGVLGEYTCWGSLYLFGDWPDVTWSESETHWSVSKPPGDRILRAVGHSAIAIWERFEQAIAAIR